MHPISIVIIAKNESADIVDCIISARQISTDIIVADSGSEDSTTLLALQANARVLPISWQGYGQSRNEAAGIAANDWIFALDADERITPELATTINNLSLNDDRILYGVKRVNYFVGKKISFGEWGRDRSYRLYNRKQAAWDLRLVHENIVGDRISKKIIPGSLLHYTIKSIEAYYAKTILYARLSAQKYAEQGKKPSFIKRYISPGFSFLQNYIFRLGFLDGKEGFLIAYTSSRYIYLKYHFLKQLLKPVK